MTDRYNALLVVLDKDMREDDAQSTIDAIKHIKGVVDVKGNVSNIEADIAESRVKQDLWDKIYKLFWDK